MPDYDALLFGAESAPTETVIAFLREELPLLWAEEYRAATQRPTNLLVVTHGSFDYVYDAYTDLVRSGKAPADAAIEDRLMAALGQSRPPARLRESSRMKGWLGPTGKAFGEGRDKGHFIAHTIGGAMDGVELNMFSQRRELNRGWSVEGRRFREMEQHCAVRQGTFCFHRPFYTDNSSCPAMLEFGILFEDNRLWVERFAN